MKHTLELGLTDHLNDISYRLGALVPLLICRDDISCTDVDCLKPDEIEPQIVELVIRQLSEISLDLRSSSDRFMLDIRERDNALEKL